MLNVSLSDSSYVASVAGVQKRDHADLVKDVMITSILFETVHPTLIITEAVTVADRPTVVIPDTSSLQTPKPEIVHTQETIAKTETNSEATTHSTVDTSTTHSPTSSESSATPTTLSSASLQPHGPFHTSEASVFSTISDTQTSIGDPALVTSPSSSENPSTTWPSSSVSSTSSTLETMTSVITMSSSQSVSPSSTTLANVVAGSNTSNNESSTAGTKTGNRNLSVIVGGSVGAATFAIVLVILALCLIRRRRRASPHRRQNSRQGLLPGRSSTSSSFLGHSREISQPFFFEKDGSASIPSAPVFPVRRNFSFPTYHPESAPAFGASVQTEPPCLEKVYLQGEAHEVFVEDRPLDPGFSPVSPIIEVYPPSRSVSNYSRPSGHGGSGYLDYGFESYPNSCRTSTYRPGESTLTLPHASSQTVYSVGTAKTRDSIRSDPFDLEAPPSVRHKDSPDPSLNARWSFGF
ncbi:hypothetical protein N7454_005875 [Penicillium verhagenii]|nr:hypothetical protein N7454_005875 [Penicillium verhagenii]